MAEQEYSRVLNADQIEKMSKRVIGLDKILYDADGSFEQTLNDNEHYTGKLRSTKEENYADLSVTIGDDNKPNFQVFASTNLGFGGLCALLSIRNDINKVISKGADIYLIEKIGKTLAKKRKINYDGEGIFTGAVKCKECGDETVGKVAITKKNDYAEVDFELFNPNGTGWLTTISTDLKPNSDNLKALQDMRNNVKLTEVFEKAGDKYMRLLDEFKVLFPIPFRA